MIDSKFINYLIIEYEKIKILNQSVLLDFVGRHYIQYQWLHI